MLRWPWVPRWLFDQTVTMLQSERDGWKSLANDVVKKSHELRLRGADAPLPQPTAPEPEMPPEILMRAIREVSPRQDEAYRMNYQWSLAQKSRWDDEPYMQQCAHMIRRGSAPSYDDDVS